jgi:hypothetical protein
MVAAVPFPDIAAIIGPELGVARCQRAQAIR